MLIVQVMPARDDQCSPQRRRLEVAEQRDEGESPASKTDGNGAKDGLEPWTGTLTGVSIAADCSVCLNRPVQVGANFLIWCGLQEGLPVHARACAVLGDQEC